MSYTLVYIIAFFMLAVGAGFIYFAYKRTGRLLPDDVAERMGVLLSGALVVAAMLLIWVTATSQSDPSAFAPAVGPRLTDQELNAPAPNFPFRLVETDEETDLDAYKGNVLLINFWATWCAPCLKELPDLNDLQDRYAEQGLLVLTISDEPRDALVDFEERLPLKTVSGYVDGKTMPLPYRRTNELRPTSYVIDREGIIRDFVLGAQDYATFDRMIRPLLRTDLARAN